MGYKMSFTNPAGISALKSGLPASAWTEDADIIAPQLTEWRDKYFGQTPIMLTPRSTKEVAAAVKICGEYDLKIVPQGGNTGLVGGQTPQGEVLLSLKKMTAIRSVNPVTNALIIEAGAVLTQAQDAAQSAGRKFPLTLSSEGSCTVGGVLSTNAGGNHVLKYGTTKDLVFGVEAVLASGEIYNGLTSLRKDNTGYDLSRLFLGAEGTLGIITAASLKLFPQPSYVQRAMVALNNPAEAIELLGHCRSGDALAMFEVMPAIGYHAVIDNFSAIKNPFTRPYPWYAVIDWEVNSHSQGAELAEAKLGAAMERGLILDAVIAQNETQAAALQSIREHMSAGQKFLGGSIKQDITVPISDIPQFFETADAAMEKLIAGCRPVGFGHFGDGNIHYNIAQPIGMNRDDFLAQWDRVSQTIFDIVDSFGGSISAEHGIGIMKKNDLAARAPSTKINMLRSIKKALDPKNMMNPRVMI
jgi:FAD/FMN-containing dehydrogenase